MTKLSIIEIIKLIAAINDSTLLRWKHRCNPDAQIQLPKSPEQPPFKHTTEEIFNFLDATRTSAQDWKNYEKTQSEETSNEKS